MEHDLYILKSLLQKNLMNGRYKNPQTDYLIKAQSVLSTRVIESKSI